MPLPILRTQVDQASQFTNAATGVTKHLGKVKTIEIFNEEYTPPQLVAALNGYGKEVSAITTGAVALRNQRQKLKTTGQSGRDFLAALHGYVAAKFGASMETLADFGFVPKKPRSARTLEQKTAAADKLRQTRAILGTKGAKQKEAALEAAHNDTPEAAPSAPAVTPSAQAAAPALRVVSPAAPAAPAPTTVPTTSTAA